MYCLQKGRAVVDYSSNELDSPYEILSPFMLPKYIIAAAPEMYMGRVLPRVGLGRVWPSRKNFKNIIHNNEPAEPSRQTTAAVTAFYP